MITQYYNLTIKGADPLNNLIDSGYDFVSAIEQAQEGRQITDLTNDTNPDALRFKCGKSSVTFLPGYQEQHIVIESKDEEGQRETVTRLVPLLDSGLEATAA